jgi:hypothetical protein
MTMTIAVPDLAGYTAHYGIRVREVRDGDDYVTAVIALDWPATRRVLAAFNAHARAGKWTLPDDLPAGPLAGMVRQCWAVVVPVAGVQPIYDGLTVQPIRWDASPLDAGSFPVTVLEPGPKLRTPGAGDAP